MELSFVHCRNDYLVYGITEDFIKNNPELYESSYEKFYPIAKDNLKKHNYSVDYVLTHKREYSKSSVPRDEKLYDLCEFIEANVDYKKWYFGHSHKKCEVDAKHEFIYDELKSL